MNDTQATLEALKSAQANPLPDSISKAYTQSGSATSGLTMYDLEAGAKTLYPVNTPLRNMITRVNGGMGIQANWRVVTGINPQNIGIGIGEGKRGYEMGQTVEDRLAKFVGLGLNNSVTFEADYAAVGFDDIKARAAKDLLQAVMVQEEFLDYAGNGTLALGTTPTPTLVANTTGGSLGASLAINVFAVALTQTGFQQLAGFNNGTSGQVVNLATAALSATFTRTDIGDGTTQIVAGGVARKSAVATVTTSVGTTNSIAATVSPVTGAFGYAWFYGIAGSEVLGALTSINSAVFTATATGTQNISVLPATDNSADSTVYDGILSQILKSGSGSYVKALNTGVAGVGSSLTSDGAGGIVEIEDALLSFYNLYRLSPDIMFVSANVQRQINKLIIANGGAPLIRYAGELNGNSGMSAGTVVNSYLNKVTGTALKIVVHPNAALGTIMFYSTSVPYPVSDVGSIVIKKLRKEYHQIVWPLRSRKYEFGVYFNGVLQNYFPPAFGLIYNIAA